MAAVVEVLNAVDVVDIAAELEVLNVVDFVDIEDELEVVELATVEDVELIDRDPVLEMLGFGEP